MRYLIVCGGKIDKELGLNEIKTDGIDAIIAADSKDGLCVGCGL